MRRPLAAFGVGLFFALALHLSPAPAAQGSPPRVDFVRDIQPLFRQQCIGCHGPGQQMNGLRLDRRRDAMRGGTLPVIGPGNGEASQLYLRVSGTRFGTQMPPTGALKPEQVALIKSWIDQGAEWPDEAANDAPVTPPDPGAVKLNDALRRDDRAAFTGVLSAAPAAANAKGNNGITPLMAATIYGDVSAMQALLAVGADVNARNEAGATALMWAVGDPAKTQLLVERGADVNAASNDFRTPLMIAAGIRGSSATVKMLLAKGANTSARAPALFASTNPLVEAASVGNEDVFRLLVSAGADVAAAGPVAIYMATLSGCEPCAETLIKAAPPPVVTIAAFLLAPPGADASHTGGLPARGADVNARDPEGRPLIVSVASSDALPVATMEALLKGGADVNATGPNGETALDAAVERGATPLVSLLTRSGAKRGAGAAGTPPAFAPAASPRAAITRALPLIQRTDETFLKKSGCVSCHNNTLAALTMATARQRQLPVDESIARRSASRIAAFIESWRERALQNIGIPGDSDTISYILLGLAAENHAPDAATDAMARFLMTKQLADGRWHIFAHRPPIESSDVEVTAVSMRALQTYAPRVARGQAQAAIARAAAWLATARVASTEDRVYQLMGLAWSGASRQQLEPAARALLAEQRSDGGWAQIPTLQSDAYATGQALVALAETDTVPMSDARFQRGVQYLMSTQAADGSWFVATRSIAIQPLFNPDFPYGRNAFVSAAATNWATRALTYTVAR